MSIRTYIMCIIMSFSGYLAFADDDASSSTTKIEDVNGSFNKVGGEDVDETLTNAKLRAETGSKSKFSIATSFNYDGGSINKPLASDRPNIQGASATSLVTDLNGQINGKYNITQKDSILIGGGIRWVNPIAGGKRPANYSNQLFDVFDPAVNYQRVYKVGGLQSYFQVGPTFFTRTDVTSGGYIANLGIYNVNAYEIGTTGITVGLESGLGYNLLKSPATDDDRAGMTDYSFQLYPYMGYQLSSILSLRTVAMIVNYEHTLAMKLGTFQRDKAMQSFGLGISVTRDVFLYPNIQFIPDQVRAQDTNVGISANLNIF